MKKFFLFGIIFLLTPFSISPGEQPISMAHAPLIPGGIEFGQLSWDPLLLPAGQGDFVNTARTSRRRARGRTSRASSGGGYSRDWEVGYAAHVNYYMGASTENAEIGFAPIHIHILQKNWAPFYPFGDNNSSQAMYLGAEVQYHKATNSGGGQIGFTQFGPVLSQRFYDALGKSWFVVARLRAGASLNEFYAVNASSTRDVSKSGYASYVGAGIGIGLDLPPLRNIKLMYQPTFTFVGEGVVVFNSISLGLAVNF